MAIIRSEKNDNGGVNVWDDADPDLPIHLSAKRLAGNWDEVNEVLTPDGETLVANVLRERANQPDTNRQDFSAMLDELWLRWIRKARNRIPNDSTDIDGRLGSDIHAAMRKIKRA